MESGGQKGEFSGPITLGQLQTQKEKRYLCISNRQKFSSVTHSCPTLRDPMNRSMPGLPVHHKLPEFTQTHVH